VDRPDVTLLKAVADRGCIDLLRSLLDGPATQKDLMGRLGLNSGTVSRRMGELETLGLVVRDRAHAPYRLRHAPETRTFVQITADLAKLGMRSRYEESDAHSRDVRKAGLKGGHLRDRMEDLA
jgi:DNA-binding HxlR family transcriptional regulator